MSLTRAVAQPLPQLPVEARVLLLATIESEAFRSPAGPAGRLLGLARRQSLYTALRSAGLPPWGTLRGWLLLLERALDWESLRYSLGARALKEGHNPSGYYRMVERLTGRRWTEVKLLGSDWVLAQLAGVLGVRAPSAGKSNALPSRGGDT